MRGCQDQVSWSKKGLIAFICNGKAFLTIPCCQDGHRWSMVQPMEVPLSSQAVHVCWSSVNYDLAIVDALGRVQITTIGSEGQCNNYIVGSFAADSRPRPSELDVVIGTYWLGVDKKMVMPTPDGSSRPWEPSKAYGPFHPTRNRGALLAVNGNGMMRLLFQLPSLRYHEVDTILSDVFDVRNVTFCPVGNSLLVAVYSGDRQMSIFEVAINWQNEQTTMKSWIVASIDKIPDPNVVSLSMMRPPFSENEIILQVICVDTSYRYKINNKKVSLHSAFVELSTTCETAPSIQEWTVEPAGSVTGSSKVKAFYALDLFTLTVYVDGTTSVECLVQGLTSFADHGLGFSRKDLQSSALCFSPTGCAACYLDDDGKPQISLVSPVNEAGHNLHKVATVLATYYAFTVFNSIQSSDDVVAVCWRLIRSQKNEKSSQLFSNMLEAETQRLLNVSFAAPVDSRHIDLAIIIPSPLQKLLAFQTIMGTSEGWSRTSGGTLSLAVLNLQMAAVSATWTLKKVMIKQPVPPRGEIALRCFHVSNMFGQVRWVSDLVARISQELYSASVAFDSTSGGQTKNSAQHLLGEEPNVLLSLCFASITRFLLKYALSGIRSLSYAIRSIADVEAQLGLPAEECIAAQTKKRFETILKAVPVSVEKFERVLKEFDAIILQHFTKQHINDTDRQAIDAELVRNAKCPSVLLPMCDSLVQAFRTNVLGGEKVDLAKLYFYDTNWLHIDEATPSFDVDGIRKRLLPGKGSLRCSRCGMKTIHESPKLQNIPHWTVLFQRQCVCGGTWIKNIAS